MMKPTVAAIAFGVAAIAMPVVANAAGKPVTNNSKASDSKTSAVGEFWFGYSFLSDDNIAPPIDDSYPDLGGALRVNVPVGGDFSLQLDLQAESAFADDTSKNYTGSVLSGAHASWREPSQWLLGAFGGIGNGFNAADETATTYLIGAEGQYYLTDWTFYAQAGYTDAEESDGGTPDAFRNAWFGRGVARYFFDGNAKLEGEVSYASGEEDTDADDMDVWGWGLRYERAMPGIDAGVFLAYQGNYYDNSTEARTLTEHTLKLGLSFAFGVEGQKYVDRHGATLDLPMVTRWSAYGVDMLDN